MSELDRIKRLAKSLIPRFPQKGERNYHLDDARMMINDLGMALPPEVLAYLVDSDEVLDDFLNAVYHLEDKYRRRVVTEQATLDPKLEPKVYFEEDTVAFAAKPKREELIFAEYELPRRLKKT